MALFLLCPNLGWIQGQFNFTELSLRYLLRGLPPHPQPEFLVFKQLKDPSCHRPGIPHRYETPRPPLHDLLRDAADRARHNRGAAGQGFEDGVREGLGPGGMEVEVGGQVVAGDLSGVFLVGDEPDLGIPDSSNRVTSLQMEIP